MNPRIAAFASLVASIVLIVTVIVYSSASSATSTSKVAPEPIQSSLDELKQRVEMRDKERLAKLGKKLPSPKPAPQPVAAAAPTAQPKKPNFWNPQQRRFGTYSRYKGN